MATTSRPPRTAVLVRWRRNLFLALVAVLPLHTVFLSAWVSWKPYLMLVVVLGAWDAVDGRRERRWPWHVPASIGLVVFLAAALASWPGSDFASRFSRLLLALGVGGAVMLVTERSMRTPGMEERTLRVVFWSGAAMGISAVILGLLAAGTFGLGAIDAVNDLPGLARVTKAAYLQEGFLALTNWHQDPGYAAAWTNLWAALVLVASVRGLGSGRPWLDAAVLGGLGLGTVLTFSRTGWVGLVVGLALSAWLLVRRRWTTWRQIAALLGGGALATLLLLGLVWGLDRRDVGNDIGDALAFRLDQRLSLGPGTGPEGEEGPFTLIDYRGEVWPEYVDLFREDPLRGAGLGVGWQTEGLQEPHNLLLELIGEMGLVGLTGFAVLIGAVLITGGGVVGTVALVVSLLAAITQTVLFEPTWWFAAGLFLAGGSHRGADPGEY